MKMLMMLSRRDIVGSRSMKSVSQCSTMGCWMMGEVVSKSGTFPGPINLTTAAAEAKTVAHSARGPYLDGSSSILVLYVALRWLCLVGLNGKNPVSVVILVSKHS